MTNRILSILAVLLFSFCGFNAQLSSNSPRARDLGIPFDGIPGRFNAITDVPGVLVGHTTLINGEGPHAIRTGVTAILPRAGLKYYPAASFGLNGDAEMSGTIFAEEFGLLRSPIMLTGTASNGTVYTSVIKWSARKFPDWPVHMPVVADTWDADVSDYLSFPIREQDVFAALDGAKSGPVAEGNVGGGTGMMCHFFKCGIGTSSRVLSTEKGGYTVGVLVQANYGRREDSLIAGVPVGREISDLQPEFPPDPEEKKPATPEEEGSILIIVATNAPVSSLTLKAMAKRATMGLARNGATANPSSGDVVLAFATTPVEWDRKQPQYVRRGETLFEYSVGPLYSATIQATEEAVINALVAAKTMTGMKGAKVHALPHDRLRKILSKYNRLQK